MYLESKVSEMFNLLISFSGGRTSAVMTRLVLTRMRYLFNDVVVVFANTGCEHPATYDFIRDCDFHWKFNTVWIEAQNFHPTGETGRGADPVVVNYETANRTGKPMLEFVKTYQNSGMLACSSTLKRDLIARYMSRQGWKRYKIAIGIRADEIDRMRDNPQIVYPLIDLGYTKEMVNAFMGKQPFDLAIPNDAYGNCVWCWKKSLRKLRTVAKYNPEFFEVPKQIEQMYPEMTMFREYRTSAQILEEAQYQLDDYTDDCQMNIWQFLDFELDSSNSTCEDSCEAF